MSPNMVGMDAWWSELGWRDETTVVLTVTSSTFTLAAEGDELEFTGPVHQIRSWEAAKHVTVKPKPKRKARKKKP